MSHAASHDVLDPPRAPQDERERHRVMANRGGSRVRIGSPLAPYVPYLTRFSSRAKRALVSAWMWRI